MNSKTKKYIAKEIIYLFSIIFLLFLIWGGIKINNTYLENKINHYTKSISILKIQIDSAKTKPWNYKYEYLLNGKKYTPEELTKYAKMSKMSLDNYIKDAGIDIVLISKVYDEYGIPIKFTPPKDGKIVSENDKMNRLQILYKKVNINNEKLINYRKDYLNESKIIFNSFIILFGLLYPIRLIFYALKWSIKTIKHND